MAERTSMNRRAALRTGLASFAAGSIITRDGFTATTDDLPKKAAGETRVLFLGGDNLHNFMAQEPALRRICESAGWTFFAVHDARFVTPELMETVDLMMIQRWAGGNEGWVSGPIMTEAPPNDRYMRDGFEDMLVDNVTKRGMNYITIHCGIWAGNYPRYIDMIGVRPIIHGPLQTVRCQHFNQDHPISRGMTTFDIPIDENFGAEITDPRTVPLYETFGLMDKRQDFGGWCTEKNKGRVVGLLAGHTYFAYQNPNYLELFRRSAYWALGLDIPPKA